MMRPHLIRTRLAAIAILLTLAATHSAPAGPQPRSPATAATPPETVVLTNAAFFRADANGANQHSIGGILSRGGWTSVLDQQNVRGNYGAEFFLAQIPSPAADDFLSPAEHLAVPLTLGDNTFYFFADGDDPAGGADTFGLNLYLDSAAGNAPSISAFTAPGDDQNMLPNGSNTTGAFDFKIVPGANTLTYTRDQYQVTLKSYEVTAASGQSTIDLVNSTNVAPFKHPPHPDGLMDTYGKFTLTVTDMSPPPPEALAVAVALPDPSVPPSINPIPLLIGGAVAILILALLALYLVLQRIRVPPRPKPLASGLM